MVYFFEKNQKMFGTDDKMNDNYENDLSYSV